MFACTCICTTCLPVFSGGQKRVVDPCNWNTDIYEPSYGCWELKPGSLSVLDLSCFYNP